MTEDAEAQVREVDEMMEEIEEGSSVDFERLTQEEIYEEVKTIRRNQELAKALLASAFWIGMGWLAGYGLADLSERWR